MNQSNKHFEGNDLVGFRQQIQTEIERCDFHKAHSYVDLLDVQIKGKDDSAEAARAVLLRGEIYLKQAEFSGDVTILQKNAENLQKLIETKHLSNYQFYKTQLLLAQNCFRNLKPKEGENILSKVIPQIEKENLKDLILEARLLKGEMMLERFSLEECQKYVEETLVLCRKWKGRPIVERKSLETLSIAHTRHRNLDELFKLTETLLQHCDEKLHKDHIAVAQNNIGIYYIGKSSFRKALHHFSKGLDMARSIQHQALEAKCLINIGTLYNYMCNDQEALRHFDKVNKAFSHVITNYTLVAILYNMGVIYKKIEDYAQCNQHLLQAYYLSKSMDYSKIVPRILTQVSNSYLKQGNIEKAAYFEEEAKKCFEEKESYGIHLSYINQGELCLKRGDLDEAEKFIKEAREKCLTYNDKIAHVESLEILARIYEQKEDYKKAYIYSKLYNEKEKELAKEIRDRQMLDFEIRYETKEKEQAILSLQKEVQYKELLIDKSRLIEQQNEKLKVFNEELKQFTYAVGHDLKQPIRMIGSYSAFINKIYYDKLDDQAREFFGFINGGVKRITLLIDDLMEYARVGAETPIMEPLDLEIILAAIQQNLAIQIKEQQAEISYRPLPFIHSNKILIIQLLQNLVSNAIKFTPKDRIPQVFIGYQLESNAHVISIQDNGIGIPKEQQERIFTIFQRLHTSEEFEGTGIGLAVCQKIIRRLGGKIWLESEPGKGSCFYFSIPR